MTNIIFVCLGNICRSPLAEATFIKKLKDLPDAEGIRVLSAATSEWNIGDEADERAIKVALKYNYNSILKHRSKLLSNHHILSSTNTIIICMDESNKQSVKKMINSSTAIEIKLFSDFGDDIGTEIIDPYYGEFEDFEKVLIQCERYSEELLNYVIPQVKQ